MMRSRVRRLGRSGTAGSPASAGPRPLAGSREPEVRQSGIKSAGQGLVDDHSDTKCTAPLPLSRSVRRAAPRLVLSCLVICHMSVIADKCTVLAQDCSWQLFWRDPAAGLMDAVEEKTVLWVS